MRRRPTAGSPIGSRRAGSLPGTSRSRQQSVTGSPGCVAEPALRRPVPWGSWMLRRAREPFGSCSDKRWWSSDDASASDPRGLHRGSQYARRGCAHKFARAGGPVVGAASLRAMGGRSPVRVGHGAGSRMALEPEERPSRGLGRRRFGTCGNGYRSWRPEGGEGRWGRSHDWCWWGRRRRGKHRSRRTGARPGAESRHAHDRTCPGAGGAGGWGRARRNPGTRRSGSGRFLGCAGGAAFG